MMEHANKKITPMPQAPNKWMPREQWDALLRGDQCPFCAACQTTKNIDAYGYTIADLAFSRLRLVANQFVAGYCVLICMCHVREPYELTLVERTQFFEDMMHAAQALDRVFQPIKMNFALLGNTVPHLHAHLIPRYYGDPAPEMPIDPGAQVMILTTDEYEARVHRIQLALGTL